MMCSSDRLTERLPIAVCYIALRLINLCRAVKVLIARRSFPAASYCQVARGIGCSQFSAQQFRGRKSKVIAKLQSLRGSDQFGLIDGNVFRVAGACRKGTRARGSPLIAFLINRSRDFSRARSPVDERASFEIRRAVIYGAVHALARVRHQTVADGPPLVKPPSFVTTAISLSFSMPDHKNLRADPWPRSSRRLAWITDHQTADRSVGSPSPPATPAGVVSLISAIIRAARRAGRIESAAVSIRDCEEFAGIFRLARSCGWIAVPLSEFSRGELDFQPLRRAVRETSK